MAIAESIIDEMIEECLYIVGPGSSTVPIMEQLRLPYTLLGMDLIRNKKLICNDPGDQRIQKQIHNRKAKLILTPIGGQGFILGRGNQQISPEIVQMVGKENIIIIATQDKLFSLKGRPLLVDTGSKETDQFLSGYVKVITGRREMMMHKVSP